MAMGFHEDYSAGTAKLEKFAPEIIRRDLVQHCGPVDYVEILPEKDNRDLVQSTDMVVRLESGRSIAFAGRVRDIEFAKYFRRDFTLTLSRTSGAKTEYEKIMHEGHAEMYFYALSELNNPDVGILEYQIFSCDVLRQCRQRIEQHAATDVNHEGTGFRIIPWALFPEKDFLIGGSWEPPTFMF